MNGNHNQSRWLSRNEGPVNFDNSSNPQDQVYLVPRNPNRNPRTFQSSKTPGVLGATPGSSSLQLHHGQDLNLIKAPSRTTNNIQQLGSGQQKMDGGFRDPEILLRMFRSMECECCQRHFGFQSRNEKALFYCSLSCTEGGNEEVPGTLLPQIKSLQTVHSLPSELGESVSGNFGSYISDLGGLQMDPPCNNFGRGRGNADPRGNSFGSGDPNVDHRGNNFGRAETNLGPKGNRSDRGETNLGPKCNRSDREETNLGPKGNRSDREETNLGPKGYSSDREGQNVYQRSSNGERGSHGRGGYLNRGSYSGRGGQSGGRRGNTGSRGGRSGEFSSSNNQRSSNDDAEWVISPTPSMSSDVPDACQVGIARTPINDVTNLKKVDKINTSEPIRTSVLSPSVESKSTPQEVISIITAGPGKSTFRTSEIRPSESKNLEPAIVQVPVPIARTAAPSLLPEENDDYEEIRKVACNPFLEIYPAPVRKHPLVEMKLPANFPTVEIEPNSELQAMSCELGWSQLELGLQQIFEKTHTNSFNDFFVQTFDGKKIATLMIDEIYESLHKTAFPLKSLEVGSLCLAPFENIYYRAEITKVSGDPKTYSVFFCDYGNKENVPGHLLFEMPPSFKMVPRCVAHCRWDMAELKELPDSQLQDVYESPTLPVTPRKKILNGQYLVSLSNFTPKGKIIIKTEGKTILVENQAIAHLMTSNNLPMNITTGSAATSNDSGPKIWNINNCQFSPAIVTGAEVRVSFFWNLSRYLISAVKDDQESFKVQDAILKGKFEPTKQIPKVGDILLGKYEEDYYRGQVKEISGDKVILEFVDFGDNATLKWNELLLPSDELMTEHPLYGMSIMLEGLGKEPPGASPTAEIKHVAESVLLRVVFKEKPGHNAEVQLLLPNKTTFNDKVANIYSALKRAT